MKDLRKKYYLCHFFLDSSLLYYIWLAEGEKVTQAEKNVAEAKRNIKIRKKIMIAFERAIRNEDHYDGEVELIVLYHYYGAKKASLEAYARFIENYCPDLILHRDGGFSVTRRNKFIRAII